MSGLGFLGRVGIFRACLVEQRAALDDYWRLAGEVLEGSGVRLAPLPRSWKGFAHNRLSVLFLAVFRTLGIPAPRRRLHALATHCLRSWVTACDNLLDDELRETLLTDLPAGAAVFKSVHAILVADRVLFLALHEAQEAGTISRGEARALVAAGLAALSASGRQEAEEEDRAARRLPPGRLLREIHARKAGRLFTAPLAGPEAVGDVAPGPRLEALRAGLHDFGVAVQILDDLHDVGEDLARGRQNYLASLAAHGGDSAERLLVEAWERSPAEARRAVRPWERLPAAWHEARDACLRRFSDGFEKLGRGGLALTRLERSALAAGFAGLAADPRLAERLRAR